MAPSDAAVTVVLQQPKYVQNLGAAVRACAAFDVSQLMWTGGRITFDIERLPRELRMKDYQSVRVVNTERPFDTLLTCDIVPVCIELVPGAISLASFIHPLRAAYVFGPEDGSVSQTFRRFCHHFVYVPSKYCLNLAATVNVVLYDRQLKESYEIEAKAA